MAINGKYKFDWIQSTIQILEIEIMKIINIIDIYSY